VGGWREAAGGGGGGGGGVVRGGGRGAPQKENTKNIKMLFGVCVRVVWVWVFFCWGLGGGVGWWVGGVVWFFFFFVFFFFFLGLFLLVFLGCWGWVFRGVVFEVRFFAFNKSEFVPLVVISPDP